ncbi:Amidase 1 [Trebouxia sp. C0009 RCD-2024]
MRQPALEHSDSDSDTESSNTTLLSHHSSTSRVEPPEVDVLDSPSPTKPRVERLRARQALQSAGAKKEDQQKLSMPSHRQQKPSAAILGCLAAAALATACIGWWFKRRKMKHKTQDARQLFIKCTLAPSQAVMAAVPAPPLLSTTFITTAVFGIEDLTPDHATAQSGAESNTGFSSAHAVQEAISAGATCIGRTHTSEIASRMVDPADRRSNPSEKNGVVGITASSAALVVAQQEADFAVTSDHLAGARTAAACCGLYAYRPTRGTVSRAGMTLIAGELDSVAWLCRTAALLPRIGDAFHLPGKTSETELAKLIVAQDLFGLWEDDLTVACTAALIGAQKWAGDDVAPVSLLVYLRDSVPAARPLMESDSAEQLMAAFGKAGTLIQQSEFARCRAEQAEQVQANADTAFQEDAASVPEVDADSLAAAKQVQAELHRAMHAALSTSNGFLILPTTPGPPVHHSASTDELECFERRTYELSSLATLSGVPQVTIPVVVPGQPVTSVSILGLHKCDMRLLHLAAKLGPVITQAAHQVVAAMAEQEAAGDDAQEAPEPGGSNRTGKPSRAESFKAQANEAFKCGDFDGAIAGYSGAIQADPHNPVYFSNRAMAYLKVMRFAEAKDDCDSALNLELNVKTLLRRGTAWLGLQEIESAQKDFKHVLSLEPNNRQARQELKALKEQEAMFADEESHIVNGTAEGLL